MGTKANNVKMCTVWIKDCSTQSEKRLNAQCEDVSFPSGGSDFVVCSQILNVFLRYSQNDRISQVGRDSQGSLSPTLGSTKHHPKSKHCVWECCPKTHWTLSAWGYAHCPGESVSYPPPSGKEPFPNTRLTLHAILLDPVTVSRKQSSNLNKLRYWGTQSVSREPGHHCVVFCFLFVSVFGFFFLLSCLLSLSLPSILRLYLPSDSWGAGIQVVVRTVGWAEAAGGSRSPEY